MTDIEFKPFPSISRLSRNIVITEKLDGTNASIFIAEDGNFIAAGSRTRWLTPENDNYGFCKWVLANWDELAKLGPGQHFGEWWGQGIQIRYGLKEKRFSLFNTHRWSDDAVRPKCCSVVPVLYTGPFNTAQVDSVLEELAFSGSVAAPGFMRPEGIVIYHKHSGTLFKKTIKNDDKGKSYGS